MEVKTDEYSYDLPQELIAATPAEPRDASRLFVVDAAGGNITLDIFNTIDRYLPEKPLIVLNDTAVVPARIELRKDTGGKVEALFLMNEWMGGDEPVRIMADRKISVGGKLYAGAGDNQAVFEVVRQEQNIFYLKPLFDPREILTVLDRFGRTPVPKYIKGIGLSENELRSRYQTVFAKNPASVAAPTASLHMTNEVIQKLQLAGAEFAKLSLHVGMGTFAPVTSAQMTSGNLHGERYFIPEKSAAMIRNAKEKGRPVVAVGTTVVRALESAAAEIISVKAGDIQSETNIFIRPPYNFKIVDALVTNFHLPNSSLMMMVQAFLTFKGSSMKLRGLYERALSERFRFYSFGDAMLIR